MTLLYDRVGVSTATTGTGTLTLGGVIDASYNTFGEAGAVTGDVLTYIITTSGLDYELGRGTYNSTGPTLTRDTVLISKIGGTAGTTKLTLAGTNQVRSTIAKEDLVFVDVNSNIVIGGTAAQVAAGSVTPDLQVLGTSVTPSIGIFKFSNDTTDGTFTFQKSRGATIGSMTVVQNNDTVGHIYFNGSDGANYINAAAIIAEIDGTPGTNDMPGRLRFLVTPDGTASPVEVMRFDNSGRVLIGNQGGTIGAGGSDPFLQLCGVSAINYSLAIQNFGNLNAPALIHMNHSKSGTLGSHTLGSLASGDGIGEIRFKSSDTTGFQDSATITVNADGAGAAGSVPARIVFKTTPSGATSTTERVRISASGGVFIGTAGTDPGTNNLQVQGSGIAPILAGGTAITSTLTLESTTGAGTSDAIIFKTASQNERMRIVTGGHVCISDSGFGPVGVTTVSAGSTDQGRFQVQGVNAAGSTMSFLRFSADALAPRFVVAKSRGATVGDFTAVTSGDALGDIVWNGADGTNMEMAARIQCFCEGTIGADIMPGRLVFSTTPAGLRSPTERLRIDSAGVLTVAASGTVILAAGTATTGPLQFTAGTNLTTAVDGAMEFDGLSLFFTPDASDRRILPSMAYIRQHATFTLASQTTAQKIFNGSANGRVTLPIGAYEFEAVIALASMSATSGNAMYSLVAGTAVIVNGITYWTAIDASATGTGGVAFQSGYVLTAVPVFSPTDMATAAVTTNMFLLVRGTFEISTAGTVTPSISLTTAATAIVQIGSYWKCWRMGATTDVIQGNWS